MIFLELFLTFFKIGLFTFGGGYAMLPFIQSEVALHGWMDEADLLNFVAVSESTPGPFAINIATYVGAQVGGGAGDNLLLAVLGSLCATLGVVMPSVIVILIVAKCYEKFKSSRIVHGCMTGLKPAVVGMIGAAIWSAAVTVFLPKVFDQPGVFIDTAALANAVRSSGFYVSLVIFAVMVVLAFKKLHPILLICLSAGAGIAAGYLGWL